MASGVKAPYTAYKVSDVPGAEARVFLDGSLNSLYYMKGDISRFYTAHYPDGNIPVPKGWGEPSTTHPHSFRDALIAHLATKKISVHTSPDSLKESVPRTWNLTFITAMGESADDEISYETLSVRWMTKEEVLLQFAWSSPSGFFTESFGADIQGDISVAGRGQPYKTPKSLAGRLDKKAATINTLFVVTIPAQIVYKRVLAPAPVMPSAFYPRPLRLGGGAFAAPTHLYKVSPPGAHLETEGRGAAAAAATDVLADTSSFSERSSSEGAYAPPPMLVPDRAGSVFLPPPPDTRVRKISDVALKPLEEWNSENGLSLLFDAAQVAVISTMAYRPRADLTKLPAIAKQLSTFQRYLMDSREGRSAEEIEEGVCPITLRRIVEPVEIHVGGRKLPGVFEREALEKWLAIGMFHPVTRESIPGASIWVLLPLAAAAAAAASGGARSSRPEDDLEKLLPSFERLLLDLKPDRSWNETWSEGVCPLALSPLVEPVVIHVGGRELPGVFERKALEKWLAIGMVHPFTKEYIPGASIWPASGGGAAAAAAASGGAGSS